MFLFVLIFDKFIVHLAFSKGCCTVLLCPYALILESITRKEFKNLLESLALAPLRKSIEEVKDFIAVSFLRM